MNVPLKFLCVKLDKFRGNIVVSEERFWKKAKNEDLKNIIKDKRGEILLTPS